MKFESIHDAKFSPFKDHEVKNLNAILGGAVHTSGNGTHDEGTITKQGPGGLDDVVTSAQGTPIKSDTDLD
jgi:hypothetical protein